MDHQGIEQRRERLRLAHDRLALKARIDEVLHGQYVVGLEDIPGGAQLVALLLGQAALRRELLDPVFDFGPQAAQLVGGRNQRTGVARERGFERAGVSQRDALHAALLADQSARNLGASDRALFQQAAHVGHHRQSDGLGAVAPHELRLVDDRLAVAHALHERHVELDLDRVPGQRRHGLERRAAKLLLLGEELLVIE